MGFKNLSMRLTVKAILRCTRNLSLKSSTTFRSGNIKSFRLAFEIGERKVDIENLAKKKWKLC